jgi:Concanavalin A-like lectin/glucanases superfamily
MSSAPQPVFFLPLQYSNVDAISGIKPISYSAPTPIPPTYTQGLYGQSAYFYNSTAPGGSTVCSTYDVSALNLKIFTVSMWYLPLLLDGVNSQSYIYTEDAGLYKSYSVFPFTSTAPTGQFYMNVGFSTGMINLPLVLNKWAHLAYTIDSSGNFILYMNGVQVRNVTMRQVGSYTTTTGSVTGSGGTVTLTVASLSTFTSGMQIIGLPSGYGTVTISSPPSGSSIVCSYGGASPTIINSGTAIANTIPGNTYTTSAFPNYMKYLVLGNQIYNAKPATVQIQDVRVYNSVLTPAQIYGIYQSQGIPPMITMVPSTVQPSLLFSLNGTTNDSVLGIQGVVTGTTQYNTGQYGQAFNFLNVQGLAGTNYITATQTAVTFSNTAGFSASFWVNPTPALTATQYWFGIFNGATEILRGSVTSGASPNGLQIYLPQAPSYPTNRTVIPSLQWSHVAFVINTTTISMYVNGVYQSGSSGSYTSTGLSSFTGPIQLGSSQAGSSLGLTGYMQDFRIYNTALSAAQIYGIYQSQGIPPTVSSTLSNLPKFTYGTPNILYGTAPTGNTAAYFVGPSYIIGNYIALPSSDPSNFNFNNSNLFCEYWWYTSNTNTDNLNGPITFGLIGKSSFNWYTQIRLANNPTGVFSVAGTTTGGSVSAGNMTNGYNTWWHVAFAIDSTNKNTYAYLNGVNAGAVAYTGTITYTSTYQIQIGFSSRPSPPTTYNYDQYIQDLRMIKGGQVPTGNFTPTSAPWALNSVPTYVPTGKNVLGLQAQYLGNTVMRSG